MMALLRPFLIIIAPLGLLLLVFYVNVDGIRIWLNPDSIFVETRSTINANLVDIKWTGERFPADTLLIYSNRQMQPVEFKKSGYNQFIILYRDKMIGHFEHFKTEPWHGHDYHIILGKDSLDNLTIDVKISGPDAHL